VQSAAAAGELLPTSRYRYRKHYQIALNTHCDIHARTASHTDRQGLTEQAGRQYSPGAAVNFILAGFGDISSQRKRSWKDILAARHPHNTVEDTLRDNWTIG